MSGDIISISVPPFPDFIEGNYRTMRKGQSHVDRKNLGFFDLIVVKKGALFLAEDEEQYEIRKNEMFILLPDRHHVRKTPAFTGFIFIRLHSGSRDQKPVALFPGFRYRNFIIINAPIHYICPNMPGSENRNFYLNCSRISLTVRCRKPETIYGKQRNCFCIF